MKEVYTAQIRVHSSESESSLDSLHLFDHEDSSSEPESRHDPLHPFDHDLSEESSSHADPGFTTSEGDNHAIHVSISQKKIQQFVIKEVRTKLNHGLSVSTTEDHLRNTLGDKSVE